VRSSASSILLVGAVVAAALVAAFQTQRTPHARASEPRDERPFTPPRDETPFDPSNDESPDDEELPPNHPPIGRSGARPGAFEQDKEGEPAQAIVWKVPASWKSVPNPSTMRIATYRIPAAPGAADEAEMSVVRAGGSTEANIERWVAQFTDASSEKRAQKVVHGLKTSTVEVSGTFQAGAMTTTDAVAVPRTAWMLEGAVVETDEGLYFFRLTGPSASIKRARRDFDTLVDSIASKR
jgi:hypothetical protein